jgi:Protein kinase domain
VIGQRIDDWRITSLLGHGNQGTVYAARHVVDGRDAAVKTLLPHLCRDSDSVERFFDEARAAASVRHGGVVQIYGHGRDPSGRAYIAMERLRGETLFERLRRGVMAVDEAVGILRQLAVTLAAAHERVVHRDLKPENVFLVANGAEARVVLVDFGIAKLSDGARRAGTISGAGAFGSPPYMAPEQCRGESADRRADLYALGCLVYEMLSGTPPFGSSGATRLLEAHRHETPPPLSELADGVPPALAALVMALLAKHPDDRPATCDAVIGALDDAGLAGRVPAPPPPPATDDAAPPELGWRDRAWSTLLELPPWITAAVACVLGSTLLGVSILLGVGDSYLAAPNWGFTYAVLVPVLVMWLLSVMQHSDAALRALAARNLVRADAGDPASEVQAAARRTGRWVVGLAVAMLPTSVGVSLVELLGRAPMAGQWWSDSPAMGAIGAVAQGVVIDFILVFVLHTIAWTSLLSRWTTAGASLRLRGDPAATDPRRGFEALEEALASTVVLGVLVELIVYLSCVHHVALKTGRSFAQLVSPLDRAPLWESLRLGHYQILLPLISSAMVAGFVVASLLAVRRALAVATEGAPPAWPVRRIGLGASIALLAGGLVVTALPRLVLPGVALFAVLALAGAWRARRRATRSTRSTPRS